MKVSVVIVILCLLFLFGCSKAVVENEQTQLANPASVYCGEQGGTLRMEQDELGVHGVCTLPSGIECEEWAYFRGECPAE